LGAPADTGSNPIIPSPTGRYYRPELDVLRFVAFFLVYLQHSIPLEADPRRWLVALGYSAVFGVPVFFTLSAYLITELLTKEKIATGTVDVRGFYIRRILRIWPLYFLFLGSIFVFSQLYGHTPIHLSELAAYVFFAGNWYAGWHGLMGSGGAALWSISVEEQFYLLWPLFVHFLTRRRLGIVCCAAWVLSQIAVFSISLRPRSVDPALWTNSLTQLQYLALGAGASLFLQGSIPAFRARRRLAMATTALLIFYLPRLILVPKTLTENPPLLIFSFELLVTGAATTMLLLAFLGGSLFGNCRPLRYLGKISFGLYVYHMLCIRAVWRATSHFHAELSPFVVAVLGLLLTIAVASVSYRYFESPFLRMKGRFEVVRSRAV
jgi:peptidoglycan/LPS O-acetylase OafA/YrhL